MLEFKIPGRDTYFIDHLVLDFNGTIAFEGKIISGVDKRLRLLANQLEIHVVTADTNGSVLKECEGLPVHVHVIGKEDQLKEKEDFIKELVAKGTISIGNGVNDEFMFQASDLSIAVIGGEGCAVSSLLKSDIAVHHIHDALDLILKQNRLIATLRK